MRRRVSTPGSLSFVSLSFSSLSFVSLSFSSLVYKRLLRQAYASDELSLPCAVTDVQLHPKDYYTWEPIMRHTSTLTHALPHTHPHTKIYTHTHSLSRSLSHTHTLTHTHTRTHTKTHEDKWEAARRLSVLICVCVDTCQLIQISCYVSLCDSLDMRHTSRSNVFDTHAYSHVLDTSSIPMPIHMQLHPLRPQSLFRLRSMWGNLLFESQGDC